MFHLDTLSTLVAATLVLLLGRKLVQTVPFLKKYTIPEPVAGGLLVALALLVLKKSMDIEIDFDMSLKDPLMLAFFATIGLNANQPAGRRQGAGHFPDRGSWPAAVAECPRYRHGDAAGAGSADGPAGRVDYLIRRPRHRGGVEQAVR